MAVFYPQTHASHHFPIANETMAPLVLCELDPLEAVPAPVADYAHVQNGDAGEFAAVMELVIVSTSAVLIMLFHCLTSGGGSGYWVQSPVLMTESMVVQERMAAAAYAVPWKVAWPGQTPWLFAVGEASWVARVDGMRSDSGLGCKSLVSSDTLDR